MRAQKTTKRRNIEAVVQRREGRQVFLCQCKQTDRRPETAAVFHVNRMFEILLQMNERPRRLDQSLEKIVIGRVAI